MKGYKAFNGDMTCTKGNGIYQYAIGGTYEEKASKTARCGFHICENPIDCLSWYSLPLGRQNTRLCQVEATGDLDEIEDKISCTKMTIVRELNLKQLGIIAIKYMIEHPYREWERLGYLYQITKDKAEAKSDGLAIARGKTPIVRGAAGSCIGIIVEEEEGLFREAKAGLCGKDILADQWYTVVNNQWVEVNE